MQAQQEDLPEQRLHDYPPQRATQHNGTRNSGGGGRPRFVQDAPDDDPRGVDGHPPTSAEVGGSRNAASNGGRRTPRADGESADIEQVPAVAPIAGGPHLPEAETLPPHPTRRRRPKKNSRAAVRIASLNMNGGASHKTDVKWEKINQLIRDRGIGVLALQETHLTEARADDLRARYPRLHIVNTAHPMNDSSRDGVAIILNKYTTNWDDSETQTIIEGKALLLSLACKNSRKLHILCVYAPSGSDALNMGFWEDLDKRWHDDRDLPKLDMLLGDFNMVDSREDRLPSHADAAGVVNALTKFRERHALVDGWRQENMGARDFTYATQHMLQQNSHSRIDRIYVRPAMLDSTREWTIRTSGIPKLDHYVVSVQVAPEGTPTMGNGRQTLPQFILDDKEAFAKIAELAKSRQARIATGLQKEWALLKGDILTLGNTLARTKMANLNKNLNRWRKRRKTTLAAIAQGTLPVAESTRQLDEINAAIQRIEETKTLRMREKVAARHHLEGETNSQYDYQLNRLQRPRDTIDSLQIPHTEPPQYTLNSKEMAGIATRHHDSLQQSGDEDRPEDDGLIEARIDGALSVLKPRVVGNMANKLSEPISKDEIRNALKQVPNRKAPGLDGLPVEIWKKLDLEFCEASKTGGEAFNVVGALTAVVNDIEVNGIEPGTGFADGWMCPIYKKKARTDISNYRPITVLNTDYKIMTKSLTNRLSDVAPDLVDDDQAGFMRGRSIHDQTDLAHVVIHRCEAEKRAGAIVCLDQEKAYDRIRHDFLWRTLKRLGFPDRFINSIRSLYTEAHTRVILNGEIGDPFRITRGVRQGDPLSCLLFNLAIESLAEAIRQSPVKGLDFPGLERPVLAKLFADDTTVYLGETDDFTLLFALLERWCAASGARFNIEKTVVIPLGSKRQRTEMHRMRRYHPDSEPVPPEIHIAGEGEMVRLLGSYYGYGFKQVEVWQPTLEKVKATLGRWGRHRPTLAGRCRAATAIVGSFTQYLTRVQGMPEEIVLALEKIIDDFVFDKNGARVNNAVAIATLKAPLNEGGFKLIDLRSRNEAIALMILQRYHAPADRRPVWVSVAEPLVAAAAVSRFQNVALSLLKSPLTQQWRVFLHSDVMASA
ncbi:hypothetical protein D9611_011812 [Ephemerocybe angulata]|uniref:Reverse transcriptase domain-containing protein n=1 Tax=Ephemerocybe angulata TaxID=980116 RepID=A0A8H5BZF9_9AGAR|nr:hypothetical protein D9611_011812 [Tulosesus angulatus]